MRFLESSLAFIATISALATIAFAKSGPTCVAYIEVNTNNLTNVGDYVLTDGSNVFDIAIIFAANIDYTTKAILYNNPQVQALLNDAAHNIVPLQQKGIKVLLSILGNHAGAGVSNFPTQAAAAAFAAQVRDEVNKYGLDGVDIDDEFADYQSGGNDTDSTNNNSIGWLLQALRSDLGPSKLITFYNIDPAATTLSNDPASIGGLLNYSWNPFYGSYSAPSIPGLGKAKLSPAAIQFGATSQSTAASFAKMTVSQGYGAYMTYDLAAGNSSAYISAFTKNLYGQSAIYEPNRA